MPDGELFRCSGCGHCFYDTATFQAEEYDGEYFSQEHKNWFENPNLYLYQAILRFISERKPEGSLLDVGCGNGNFLRWLRRHSQLSLAGIDLAPNPPEEGIDFLQGDASLLSDGRKFDFIVSLAVVEHIENVAGFVQGLIRACAPGGYIILMTLNEDSILYQASRMLYKAGLRSPQERLYSRHHIHHFTVRSLRQLVLSNGLTIMNHLFHNIPLAAIDMPYSLAAVKLLMRTGIWGTFVLGDLAGKRTYLQTLFCAVKPVLAGVAGIPEQLKASETLSETDG